VAQNTNVGINTAKMYKKSNRQQDQAFTTFQHYNKTFEGFWVLKYGKRLAFTSNSQIRKM
jgi:hypothetical protein